ncbi:MAG: glycosyltransferase family 2 protein [Xanthomonadaceae bacterium]|nr:glycosyltransferase family 2 protein [Xanthomonadaceae bacterium]
MIGHERLVSVVIPVFRDGVRAVQAVHAVLAQTIPDDCTLEILLVDDASDDDTLAILESINIPQVRVLALPENLGRSGARNRGAEHVRGDFIVFMDCDCLPASSHFVAAHLNVLKSASASTGRVTGSGTGFWNHYQRDASRRRERQHAKGIRYSGSSQNLAVRTTAFHAVGGFDTRYREYGFEDRDLLLRLARFGTVDWCADAEVHHMDALTLNGVSAKLRSAGRYSSTTFSQNHPDAYRDLGYAAIDVRHHPCLRPMAAVAAVLTEPFAASLDHIGALEWLPYPFAMRAAKFICAMSFLAGTAEHSSASRL